MGCSIDNLLDLRLRGFLETLQSNRGMEAAVEGVFRAWKLHANPELSRRGVTRHSDGGVCAVKGTPRYCPAMAAARGVNIKVDEES
jgi:hypothetical protein